MVERVLAPVPATDDRRFAGGVRHDPEPATVIDALRAAHPVPLRILGIGRVGTGRDGDLLALRPVVALLVMPGPQEAVLGIVVASWHSVPSGVGMRPATQAARFRVGPRVASAGGSMR